MHALGTWRSSVTYVHPLILVQATGLALPGADLDVVVLGAHSELQTPAQGYSHEARIAISDLLEVSSLRELWAPARAWMQCSR